jgi:catechol 2,3-dioxygenase
MWGAFLQRKGNPHDVVFTNGRGPRLHHFAYTIRDAHDLIHYCDTLGSLGWGERIDRGPGRHGMGGGALFVYTQDPDGHRIELFHTHYQTIDIEDGPQRWDLSNPLRSNIWGLPAIERWFTEATEFRGLAPRPPKLAAMPPTLENYLAAEKARGR